MQENLIELRNDFTKMKLEIEALKLRQESTERLVQELQSEAVQRDEDLRKSTKYISKVSCSLKNYLIFHFIIARKNFEREINLNF